MRRLLLLTVLLLALSAPSADAFIYWADGQNKTIGRASNDGSGVDDSFIPTGNLPFAVAVDSAHIYWANQQGASIGRANIDGTGVDNGFISGIAQPSGVAVNGSSIYWSTIPGPIGRADIDGTNKQPNFLSASLPCGVALDSGHLYWADDSDGMPAYIGRADLNGQNPKPKYVTVPSTAFPCGVAVNAANIFWADPGFLGLGGTNIGRANTNTGEGADASIIGSASVPCGVALDSSSHLYWANTKTNTIGRANTDSTGVNQSFVVTGGDEICAVAVDNRVPPPAQPAQQPAGPPAPGSPDTTPPTATISKGPGKKLAEGKAKFSFRSSESGSRFECKLDSKKVTGCRSPRAYSGLKPGKHNFKVWAIDAVGNRSAKPAKRGFRVPSA